MKISVKNFGPIKHGSIDLSKRFYVFVGHNNSGKTYMANLVWSAVGLISELNAGSAISNKFLSENLEYLPSLEAIQKTNYEIPDILIDKTIEEYKSILLKRFFENFGIDEKNHIFNKTQFYLNINKDLFLKEHIKVSRIVLNGLGSADNVAISNLSFEKEANSRKLILKELKNGFDKSEYQSNVFTRNSILDKDLDRIIQKQGFNTLLELFGKLVFKLEFLPANRLFYPSFYRYVYETAKMDKDRIDEEVRKGNPSLNKIKSLSKRPYTKAMDNLLGKIYWLRDNEKPNETYTDLLQKLRQLMGGEIVTKNAEGIGLNEFKLKMDSGEELDLYLSSSAANQLTTLYLYLKYWASDSNNFLIMDEPEENLHPKHQIALLDILMQFANRNDNRVLITTHSSLLAESVNNHIQIGKLQDLGEDVERIVRENNLDISLNENLRPDDFGVYFFGNETITPYEVDDYGVFFRDFKQEENKVASTAQTLSEEIYNALEKEKNVPG